MNTFQVSLSQITSNGSLGPIITVPIYFFVLALWRVLVSIRWRCLQPEDRPVILLASQEDTKCPTSLRDALAEQSALARLNASIQTRLRLIM